MWPSHPIGGTGEDHVAIIEMHYDNPDNTEGESSARESTFMHAIIITYIGVIDSSGMKFYYTIEEPAMLAGSSFIGSRASPLMYIPPGESNFSVVGVCPAECTNSVSNILSL